MIDSIPTYKAAADFAGCSISTLKRYKCAWYNQTALDMLRYGCGAIWEKCDPKTDKKWPPQLNKRVQRKDDSQ